MSEPSPAADGACPYCGSPAVTDLDRIPVRCDCRPAAPGDGAPDPQPDELCLLPASVVFRPEQLGGASMVGLYVEVAEGFGGRKYYSAGHRGNNGSWFISGHQFADTHATYDDSVAAYEEYTATRPAAVPPAAAQPMDPCFQCRQRPRRQRPGELADRLCEECRAAAAQPPADYTLDDLLALHNCRTVADLNVYIGHLENVALRQPPAEEEK